MKVPPLAKRLIVFIPVLVMALGAASHYVQQLRATPADITVQTLLRDGYSVTETVTTPTPHDTRLVTVTTTLQRGATVFHCYELGTAQSSGDVAAEYHHCTRGAT